MSYVHIRVYCRTLFSILPLYVYSSSVAFAPLTFLVGTHVPVRMNGTYIPISSYMVCLVKWGRVWSINPCLLHNSHEGIV